MKTYKHYGTAIKHGATESVLVDGKRRWAEPGIRPNNAKESRFAMMLGGEAIDGNDRVATYGGYKDVFVLRVDGVAGGSTVEIFTSEDAGKKAFDAFSARYEADARWAAK